MSATAEAPGHVGQALKRKEDPRLITGQGRYIDDISLPGTLWAALGHGHWGAKLSRSDDDGTTWTDAAQIKYPEGARYLAPPMPKSPSSEMPKRTSSLLWN